MKITRCPDTSQCALREPAALDGRRHIAIHEAGHAVIARVLGVPCGRVTIEPDEDSAGHAIIKDCWEILEHWEAIGRDHRDGDTILRARILTCMAGRIAEEECLGECQGGDGDDRRQINFMLDDLLPPDADLVNYADRLEAKLRPIVRRHRGAIELIADLLMVHGALDGRSIPMETLPRRMQ